MQSVLYVIGALGSKDTSAKVNIKSRTAVFLPLPRCISINILSCVSACQTAVHKKCHDKLLTKCPESGKQSENTIVSICSSSILQFLFHVQFEFRTSEIFLARYSDDRWFTIYPIFPLTRTEICVSWYKFVPRNVELE